VYIDFVYGKFYKTKIYIYRRPTRLLFERSVFSSSLSGEALSAVAVKELRVFRFV